MYRLNVLEKKPLIKSVLSATDRRIVDLELRPKGKTLTCDCMPLVIWPQNDALALLGLEDYSILHGLLRELAD